MTPSITVLLAALLLALLVASTSAQQPPLEDGPRPPEERPLYLRVPRPKDLRNRPDVALLNQPHYRERARHGYQPKHHEKQIRDYRTKHADVPLLNTRREYVRHDAVVVFSDNLPGHYWNVRPGKDRADEAWEDPDRASPFRVVPGLAPGVEDGVSFEDAERPGTFLRHTSDKIVADPRDGTPGFDGDATFRVRAALDGGAAARSYESVNRPGSYIRHAAYQLRLHSAMNLPKKTFREDCSFEILGVTDLVEKANRGPPAVVVQQ